MLVLAGAVAAERSSLFCGIAVAAIPSDDVPTTVAATIEETFMRTSSPPMRLGMRHAALVTAPSYWYQGALIACDALGNQPEFARRRIQSTCTVGLGAFGPGLFITRTSCRPALKHFTETFSGTVSSGKFARKRPCSSVTKT